MSRKAAGAGLYEMASRALLRVQMVTHEYRVLRDEAAWMRREQAFKRAELAQIRLQLSIARDNLRRRLEAAG